MRLLPDRVIRDCRNAMRQLLSNPAFTITIVATLGLCIGANTAVYSVVDTLFFRPPPYPDPERLVLITTVFAKSGASDTDTSQTGRQWELVRDHASFLDAAVYAGSEGINLFASGRVEYVHGQRVSANFFKVLGVNPILGREFTRAEDIPGGPALAVLSYGLWQRLFRGDPSVVGRTLDLRGAPHTIVGIMPQGFRTSEPAELWTPLRPSPYGEGSGNNYGFIGRLRPGVTFAAANGQLTSVMRPVCESMHLPPAMTCEEKALPLEAGLVSGIRSKVNLMWGAVSLVLLIGCVNIAGILLARSATRAREIATRMALGAGRARVISQLVTESVLLAVAGAVCGLIVGQVALKGLLRLNPGEFEMWNPAHLNLRVMLVMLGISVATSMLFGLFPAFEATSVDLRSALAEGGRSNAGGRGQWKRQALVFGEVALGVVLVVGAGVLIRTFATLFNANPGFNPNHVLTASLSLRDARYATATAGNRLFRESVDRIRQIPGVESAGVALSLPYQRPLNIGIQRVSGRSVGGQQRMINLTYATPGMFAALQIPLLRGRVFTDGDERSGARVAVVNEAFVKRYMPDGADPVGASLTTGKTDYQIIGVVSSTQQKNGWGSRWGPLDVFPQAYVPPSQISDELFALANTWFSPSWIVRTHANAPGLPVAMSKALATVDPRLPFSSFHTISEIRGASLRQQRYQAILFSTLAGLATLLAALGVYGLIAQSVVQRTREMGIRLALGATTANIVRTTSAPGIALSVAGIAAGLILSLFTTRLLKSLIWGVRPTDPATFIAVATLLIFVAAFASVLPALRLTRLDPAVTLRDE